MLNFEFKPSSFYGLPKIPKSNLIKSVCSEKSEKCVEISNPEELKFRPIVAGPVCETHTLSNLIDILLKSFLKHVKSYVRDDIDFLQYMPKTISEDKILVSFDVTSLYTNISHELGSNNILAGQISEINQQ